MSQENQLRENRPGEVQFQVSHDNTVRGHRQAHKGEHLDTRRQESGRQEGDEAK